MKEKKIYKLTTFEHIGGGFFGPMKINSEVIYFRNKQDAKKLQNTFRGDKISEIDYTKNKNIFSINHIGNSRTLSVREFNSKKEAESYFYESDTTLEVCKNKIYEDLIDYRSNYKESKMVLI